MNFLRDNFHNIFVVILILFSVAILINWMALIFGWGRFKNQVPRSKDSDTLGYVISQFFVNIINDFKHLLALIIVLIFTGLIIYSMTITPIFDQKMEALQLVIASLGGLLGSIIGYYFGESAARESSSNITQLNNDVKQEDINDDQNDIEVAPKYPSN